MDYRITIERDHLRADQYNRETVEETLAFLQAVAEAAARSRRSQILVSVHASRSLFRIDPLFERCGGQLNRPPYRIALLADSEELQISHQYAEVLAQRHGAVIQSFRDETAALQWLKNGP